MEGVPIGLVILLFFAGLILLTPGGRSLLWGRWGIVEPKDPSKAGRSGRPPARLGNPFGRRFGGFGVGGRR